MKRVKSMKGMSGVTMHYVNNPKRHGNVGFNKLHELLHPEQAEKERVLPKSMIKRFISCTVCGQRFTRYAFIGHARATRVIDGVRVCPAKRENVQRPKQHDDFDARRKAMRLREALENTDKYPKGE